LQHGTGPATPGTVLQADADTGLWVACGQGEAIRLDAVALEEGYFTGYQLAALGIGAGEVLGQQLAPTSSAASANPSL
jgi:methionyl-tRNA formyltransferase